VAARALDYTIGVLKNCPCLPARAFKKGIAVIIIAIDPLRNENPFTARFSQAVASLGKSVVELRYRPRLLTRLDAVIVHWPRNFKLDPTNPLATLKAILLLVCHAIFGFKLIWVAHNSEEHSHKSDLLQKIFFKRLDGVIFMSNYSRALILASNRLSANCQGLVTSHGEYASETPPKPYSHNGDRVRLMNFGLVRRYKHLEDLISAAITLGSEAATINGDKHVEVSITGRSLDTDYAHELEELADRQAGIALQFDGARISDRDLDAAIDASHGVVLPYGKLLNSGVAIHALCRNKPILAPNTGSIPELRRTIGVEWVRTFDPPLDAGDLREFAEHVCTINSSNPDLSSLSWNEIEMDIDRFLQTLTVPSVSGRRESASQPSA